jgi:glyoxylase I family protein
MMYAETFMVLCPRRHDTTTSEPFDPRRTGLDHGGVQRANRAVLDRWKERLGLLNVTHSPISGRP